MSRSSHALSCRLGLLPLLLVLMLCTACGSRPAKRTAHVPGKPATKLRLDSPAAANDVLFSALGLVGTPYRYGGNTPEGGFDCSGLVHYVFNTAAGVSLPRQSSAIAEIDAPKVKRTQLIPGDLVFFGKRKVNHIGIYVGEGRFVHAPNSGGTVRMDHLDGAYWDTRYLYARRLLR